MFSVEHFCETTVVLLIVNMYNLSVLPTGLRWWANPYYDRQHQGKKGK
jgi:hypothetical protein